MSGSYKVLQNEDLSRIQEILIPPKSENETFTIPPGSSSSKSSSTQSTVATTEFIPHIFYTLYQIQKDPNRSNNQLETKTGLIRHRLRNCKTLIRESDSSLELLSKSTNEWEQFITNRENELQIKKNVLLDLRSKISEILTNCNYEPDSEETDPVTEGKEEQQGELQQENKVEESEQGVKEEGEQSVKEENVQDNNEEEKSVNLKKNETEKINSPEQINEHQETVVETDNKSDKNNNNDDNSNPETATAELPNDDNEIQSTSVADDDNAILDDIEMEM
ncbi:similar to Saccharomyces cerevisiae YNR010W CSE2 Subunit of the RNA polymerase II mediator complex [Maudiozyma saulgeensis]|uniref:Mediator of RNA polymerase II transcription subunit 9 n=1 Tax=Maudiozyma saulgeensis TaxID=1789683 RepID=A0A1X7R7Z1_9SACH|nr:similar to Saccharomyces cerevisiae YNR010W CSE2 Subunit of the RNA polymerase II mediator complex [Kazachstania saulgeensis]